MTHFAEVIDGIVTRVIVAEQDFIDDLPNKEQWIQTSYNHNIRKNYAGVGYSYDEVRDAFIPPKPFDSWTLNEETCNWEAPTPYPDDGQIYNWNEIEGWILLET
jgi:hypothetical protein